MRDFYIFILTWFLGTFLVYEVLNYLLPYDLKPLGTIMAMAYFVGYLLTLDGGINPNARFQK